MLKKKMRFITVWVLAMVAVFSFTITAFAANPDWSDFPVTKRNHPGDFTWAAQLVLKHNTADGGGNYLAGSVDGQFGGDTYNAVYRFQTELQPAHGVH